MHDRSNDGLEVPASLAEGALMPAIEWMGAQMPGGFFAFRADEAQEMLYVNDETLRILGCEGLDEFRALTGNTFRGFVHPDDYARCQGSIDAQMADAASGGRASVEYRVIRKDGSIRWVDHYDRIAELPGHGLVHYAFIGDITDRHYVQEDSLRLQNVYAGMMEQFNDMADNSLTVIRSNLTAGIIEEVRGKDLYPTDYPGGPVAASFAIRSASFINERDREEYDRIFAFDRLIDRSNRGLGPATFVAYCRRHSGRQCFVKLSGSAAIDPVSGDTIAFGVETEYNVERVSEILSEKVLAQQYDMVTYLVGDNYGVVFGDAANIRRGSIFPKERDGVYSDYIATQVLPVASGDVHDLDALARALSIETIARRLETEDSYIVDVTCVVGGEVVNKRFTYYLVDAEESFYILLKSDMTDILREERERNELLASTLRDAQNANEAKTAFLSSMSHEIRTPMNAIIGYDTLALREPGLSDQTRDYLRKIGSSATHLLGLINDILDMTRIESGRMALRHEEFSLHELIDQINTLVSSQCADKGLAFESRTIGTISDRYIGDDMKLKQVIINILSNAVKFTEAPGKVLFTVEQVASFESRATIRIVVRDTGIGMGQDFIPTIFDAFSQEDAGRANKYGSTGLGMAITKSIVEMMNGTIGVTSEKGEGTEFTVTLTLHNASDSSPLPDLPAPKDMRVLIVDDEEVACEHAKLVLEEVGIDAESCRSGAEALHLIELHHAKMEPYDLILMDWKMPVMDGVDVTREIRARFDDDTTIVILTSYNWDDIAVIAQEAGIDGFMTKPLFAHSVMSEFEKIAKSKGPHRTRRTVELAGRHILLAEDVPINAEMMEQVLMIREMEVDHAENGKIAVDLFAESEPGHYDAVLMDVRMPVMDGLEAAAAIRALERSDAPSVPIIALTANAFDEDVQHSLQAGMSAHLSKPVEIDRLFGMLEHLIGQREDALR